MDTHRCFIRSDTLSIPVSRENRFSQDNQYLDLNYKTCGMQNKSDTTARLKLKTENAWKTDFQNAWPLGIPRNIAVGLPLNTVSDRIQNNLLSKRKPTKLFGAVQQTTHVSVLGSHQCGPGSIPGLGVKCGLSLLLVLVLAPRGFSPGTPVFLVCEYSRLSSLPAPEGRFAKRPSGAGSDERRLYSQATVFPSPQKPTFPNSN